MAKTIGVSIDAVAPITDDERRQLLDHDAADEREVDVSDIPATSPRMWQGAERGRFYRPVKKQVTLRIDSSVLDWFRRNTPRGYQTDINRVLREYVAAQQDKAG